MTRLSFAHRFRLPLTCALAVSLLGGAHGAFAQQPVLRVQVPFAFHDGSHTFSAGLYEIRAARENMLVIQSASGDSAGLSMTQGAWQQRAPDTARLIFHKYGDEYFLSEVWTAGNTLGRKLLTSRAEKQLLSSPAKREVPGTQVALNVSHP